MSNQSTPRKSPTSSAHRSAQALGRLQVSEGERDVRERCEGEMQWKDKREGGREGGRKEGRKEGREGGKEGGSEGEGGRKGKRKEGREGEISLPVTEYPSITVTC